ncbi:MAG: choice-of-anchor D domain-containing protein [Planctomycetaceae bacterium]|nr:choice-of-anchor D domain-containing protein [Planctomycetaceae bacterium]
MLRRFFAKAQRIQKRRPQRNVDESESLEQRLLLSGDRPAFVRDGLWNFDLDADGTVDKTLNLGGAGDHYLAANWYGTHDYPTVVRNGADGKLHWESTDGVVTIAAAFGQVGDVPVVGDWLGTGFDNIGYVRAEGDGLLHWYLNTDFNFSTHEIHIVFGEAGDTPIVGNWDGAGADDPGVVRETGDGLRTWLLDTDQDPEAELQYKYGLAGDTSVVGDWTQDGMDDFGTIRQFPNFPLYWLFDVNRDPSDEWLINLGEPGDTPVVGDFRFADSSLSLTRDWDGHTYNIFPGLQGEIFMGYIEDHRPVLTTSFTIRNDGDSDLHLSEIRIEQGPHGHETHQYFEVTQAPQFVAPGETGEIVIVVDATEALHIGAFEAYVSFDTSDPDARDYRFHAVARKPDVPLPAPDVSMTFTHPTAGENYEIPLDSSDRVFFGYVEDQAPVLRKEVTIHNGSISVLNISNVRIEKGIYDHNTYLNFEIISAPSAIQPGETGTIVVELDASSIIHAEYYEGDLVFETDNPEIPDVRVHAMARKMVDGLRPTPRPEITIEGGAFTVGERVDLGDVFRGQTVTRTFTIRNDGDSALRLGNVYRTGFGSTAIGVDQPSSFVAPGGTTTFTIRFRPTSTGNYFAEFSLSNNDHDEDPFRFTVTGRGVTQSPTQVPDIDVLGLTDNARIDFGTVSQSTIGGSPRRTITIKNVGDGTLNLQSMQIQGQGFRLRTAFRSTNLLPGRSASYTVEMDVRTAGAKFGTLIIQSNDPVESPLSITLQGMVNSAPPEIEVRVGNSTLSPGQSGVVDFQGVNQYGDGPLAPMRNFNITNRGRGPLILSNLVVSGPFSVENFPDTIAPGQSRQITVRMPAQTLGRKVGNITFTTNDADESVIRVNLKGTVLPAREPRPGADPDPRLTYHPPFHSPGWTIEVAPVYGQYDPRTTAIVNMYGPGGEVLTRHFSLLTTVVLPAVNTPRVINLHPQVRIVYESPRSLSVSNPTLLEGATGTTATITRTGDLSASLNVYLSSDSDSDLDYPAMVTFAPGQDEVSFELSGIDDGIAEENQLVLLTAEAEGGLFSETTAIEIVDDRSSKVDEFLVFDEESRTWLLGVVDSTVPGAETFESFRTNPFPETTNGWKGFTGDFDGDGDLDGMTLNLDTLLFRFFENQGDGTLATHRPAGGLSTSVQWDHFMVGDFNGDGRSEVLGQIVGGTTGVGAMWSKEHTGASNFYITLNTGYEAFVVGDFNGDSTDDILGLFDNTDQTRTNLIPSISIDTPVGRRFTALLGAGQFGQSVATGGLHNYLVADYNGDGRDDLAVLNQNNQVYTAMTTGISRAQAPGARNFTVSSRSPRFSTSLFNSQIQAADVNGDGLDDLVAVDHLNRLFAAISLVNQDRNDNIPDGALIQNLEYLGSVLESGTLITGNFQYRGGDDLLILGEQTSLWTFDADLLVRSQVFQPVLPSA